MNINVFNVIFLTSSLILLPTCYCYKALFVMTFGTKSHMNFFNGMAQALTEQGHEITFLSPFKPSTEKNIRYIPLNDYNSKVFQQQFSVGIYQLIKAFERILPEACLEGITNPDVVQAMEEEYDYVILSLFFTDCFLNFVREREIPLIYASPNALMSPLSERLGAPEFLSVTPVKVLPFAYPMSFMERVITAVGNEIMTYVMRKTTEENIEKLAHEMKVWNSETPSIYELQKQASMVFINNVRALEIPIKSTPPTVIYAGGIHINPKNSLPQDLQDWLDGSGEAGFILFSLGTAVKPELMKKEHLQSIINVFRSLDQRVIWKWDSTDIENLPPNVKLSPWLPQQDILAHPKIRLFITHGGLFSSQEATYFGVPVVGMPVFGDQITNVAEIVNDGWGLLLNWDEVTEEKFKSVITETLTNPRIRETVQHRSQLMKDWPSTPKEDVAYWVEYVLRHNGAKHLQSPLVHLHWSKIYNIDVWMFIIAVAVTILIISYYTTKFVIKYLVKRCFKSKTE